MGATAFSLTFLVMKHTKTLNTSTAVHGVHFAADRCYNCVDFVHPAPFADSDDCLGLGKTGASSRNAAAAVVDVVGGEEKSVPKLRVAEECTIHLCT